MDREWFMKKADKLGLQRVATQISDSIRECIRFDSTPQMEESYQTGQSKLGGNPDVDQDFEWPSWEGVNLAFLLQINLSDLVNMPAADVLPKDGLLSFFYHPDQATWGYDPKDAESWRTFYFPHTLNLMRSMTPELKSEYLDGPYNSSSVTFSEAYSYPYPQSISIDEMQLEAAELKAYEDFYFSTFISQPKHQFLGHPYIIQNPMEIECELIANGIYCGDAEWTKHPRLAEFEEKAKDWRLLLQLDSDDYTDMMWGDVGMLYFWMREDALLAGKFADAWMVLQCT